MIRVNIQHQATKYHNVRVEVDGIVFDSKAEARRYSDLKILQAAGDIRWFNRQPSFLISQAVRYRPDFIVCDKAGNIWVEDVKGFQTKDFLIKAKIFQERYAGIELRILR